MSRFCCCVPQVIFWIPAGCYFWKKQGHKLNAGTEVKVTNLIKNSVLFIHNWMQGFLHKIWTKLF